jgi:hypothetical protein
MESDNHDLVCQSSLDDLCDEAFRRFGTRSLDHFAKPERPVSRGRALVIADALMARGGQDAFKLGRKLKRAATGSGMD